MKGEDDRCVELRRAAPGSCGEVPPARSSPGPGREGSLVWREARTWDWRRVWLEEVVAWREREPEDPGGGWGMSCQRGWW